MNTEIEHELRLNRREEYKVFWRLVFVDPDTMPAGMQRECETFLVLHVVALVVAVLAVALAVVLWT